MKQYDIANCPDVKLPGADVWLIPDYDEKCILVIAWIPDPKFQLFRTPENYRYSYRGIDGMATCMARLTNQKEVNEFLAQHPADESFDHLERIAWFEMDMDWLGKE